MLPVVGSLGSGSEIGASYYENPFVSGPFNFGSGLTNTVATSTTGPFLQIFRTADPAQLLVDPDGLVAGAPFGVGTGATWAGSTLAALGVTPGTYVWTLDSRFNGDTITLQVLEPAEAPVPGTFALLGLGLAGLGALRRRIGIRVLAA
jgi:hypothetical protein